MALGAGTLFEVMTTGDSTNNGGGFDPGQNAGFLTDLATTTGTNAAPSVTSGTYAFVAGDAGAKIYVHSGTNWWPGWYEIASVSGGAATLKAAVGEGQWAFAETGTTTSLRCPVITQTSQGVATQNTPGGNATWSIDYSQQAAAQFAYTDLVIDATTNTKCTSAAYPFGKQQVGNIIAITSGTGFTVQRVSINSVTGTTATCDKSLGTLSSTGGNGGQGGALADIASALTLQTVAGMRTFIKATATYSVGTGMTLTGVGSNIEQETSLVGYTSLRCDRGRPVIQATAAITILTQNVSYFSIQNLDFFGNAIGTKGVAVTSTYAWIFNCIMRGFTAEGITGANDYLFIDRCEVSGCAGTAYAVALSSNARVTSCYIHDNTKGGVSGTNACFFSRNIIANNTGGHGISSAIAGIIENNVLYNNSASGIGLGSYTYPVARGLFRNNIIVENDAYGINGGQHTTPGRPILLLQNNAYRNNTSGERNGLPRGLNEITLTGDPFTNAAAGDFSLNSTAGAGASCRAAGVPGVLPGGLSTGYLDIGAVQHQDPAGGGGLAANPVRGFVS